MSTDIQSQIDRIIEVLNDHGIFVKPIPVVSVEEIETPVDNEEIEAPTEGEENGGR